MAKFLSIASKILSLRGAILVTDENDELAYAAKGEFAFFSPTWTIFQGNHRVATIRRRIFAIRPIWDIKGDLGDFQLKRKIFSFTRKMYVEGSQYEDTTVNGSIWDLRFKIERAGKPIASAVGKLLTLRDRHNVQVLSDNPFDELFTVIAMLAVQLERRDDVRRNEQSHIGMRN